MLSLIVPVYRNEASIPALVKRLDELNEQMQGDFEAVVVVDGSPDRSLELLSRALLKAPFVSQLIALSRNFGAFAAITAGLAAASGDMFAVMAADLQEPADLILEIRRRLETKQFDVIVGSRATRQDPFTTRVFSAIFWRLYRTFVQRDVPRGGVDVFGGTAEFRDHLLSLKERNTTLVGLVFWLGF